MNNNCPICNKAGLPDYTNKHTVCPQCNSDLKPFLLLHSITKPNSKTQMRFGITAIGLAAVVFAALYFHSISDSKKIASNNLKSISLLQDSIRNLHNDIAKTQPIAPEKNLLEKEIAIQYKVKHGDYPSKIAQFFYNDWRMYKQIETDNNLQQPYTLKVGQSLTIKLKQQ